MAKSFTVVDNSWDFALMFTKWTGAGQIYLGFSYISVGSVEEMVNKLIARAGSEQIESLFIVGHGGPGRQGVGCGRGTGDDDGDKSLKYDLGASGYHELLGGAKKHLRRLRSKFTDDAVVALGGCSVAQGDAGKKLLSLISFETNTFVEAGDQDQSPLLPGWEGNVVRCYQNTHWVAKSKW